jgi:hypothetical protein
MEMIETLVAMAGKLTDEVAHLKSDNFELTKQITDLQGVCYWTCWALYIW